VHVSHPAIAHAPRVGSRRRPADETRSQNKGPAGCLTAIVVIAAIFGSAAFFGGKIVAPAFDANQPDTISRIITEANAHPIAGFGDGKLSLTYSIRSVVVDRIDCQKRLSVSGKNILPGRARLAGCPIGLHRRNGYVS
jgi:hypothetical protein